ncbi:hypothetical protein [Flavobacterium limi]|uniref:Uncharacterized protein n=1 Tax=Flavobacterium limi TaxID=2045105 RepID=A0ABQ1UT39_9FLAO|nr:hypothetical protein [Flavobacterium limi]GGF24344.1 hypothetical protein GCM10011518_37110 [Flavobacterium limi]
MKWKKKIEKKDQSKPSDHAHIPQKKRKQPRTGIIISIMVGLFLIAFFFLDSQFYVAKGIYKIVVVGIIVAALIIGILYFKLLFTEEANMEIEFANNTEILEKNFKSLFKENKFERFKESAIKSGLISEEGKWIFSKRKRDYSILIGKLIELKIVDDKNLKLLHKSTEEYLMEKPVNLTT